MVDAGGPCVFCVGWGGGNGKMCFITATCSPLGIIEEPV